MKYLVSAIILLLLVTTYASAQQTFEVKGMLADGEKQPVHSGEVYLLRPSDSAELYSANVLEGRFLFSRVDAAQYLLKITSTGFTEKILLIDVEKNVELAHTLERFAPTLRSVTITAGKPAFNFKGGNIVANMESATLSSVTDPMMLISKIPTVQVSSNGEAINVVGRGQPIIYINNQRSGVNDLKSLAVSDILSIELINSPSARYEAEGRTVLLVKSKRSGKEGFKGEAAQTAAVRKYYLNRASMNASYRKKKLELKANLQYNHLKTWEGNAFDFEIPSRGIRSGYHVTAITTRRPQLIGGAGAFYQFNELDYLSANTSVRTAREAFPIYTDSYLDDMNGNEQVFTSNFNKSPERYYNANFNFNKGFRKSNSNLFAGAQFTRLSESIFSDVFDEYDNGAMQPSQDRTQRSYINAWAGRLDFDKKGKNEFKWESGASFSFARSLGSSNITAFSPPGVLLTTYLYNEYNTGIYTQVSGKLRNFNLSAGIRLEDTRVVNEYTSNATAGELEKKNTNLFPKLSLTWNADSLRAVTVRYAKNINRQNYSNANQTVVYINPYFEWANNIFLDPSLYQEVASTFQYRNYQFNLGAYIHKGAVNSDFVFNEQTGILRRSELNYEQESGVFISATVPFRYRIWSSTTVMNLIASRIRDKSAVTGKSRPFVYMTTTHEFSLPGQLVIAASAWGVTKSFQGAFVRSALFAVDTSITKKFDRFTCSLRIDDVFASVNPAERFSINHVAANGKFYDNGREFSATVKYAFGRLKESTFRNRDVDENSRRVR
jgi:hypothetical protein